MKGLNTNPFSVADSYNRSCLVDRTPNLDSVSTPIRVCFSLVAVSPSFIPSSYTRSFRNKTNILNRNIQITQHLDSKSTIFTQRRTCLNLASKLFLMIFLSATEMLSGPIKTPNVALDRQSYRSVPNFLALLSSAASLNSITSEGLEIRIERLWTSSWPHKPGTLNAVRARR